MRNRIQSIPVSEFMPPAKAKTTKPVKDQVDTFRCAKPFTLTPFLIFLCSDDSNNHPKRQKATTPSGLIPNWRNTVPGAEQTKNLRRTTTQPKPNVDDYADEDVMPEGTGELHQGEPDQLMQLVRRGKSNVVAIREGSSVVEKNANAKPKVCGFLRHCNHSQRFIE